MSESTKDLTDRIVEYSDRISQLLSEKADAAVSLMSCRQQHGATSGPELRKDTMKNANEELRLACLHLARDLLAQQKPEAERSSEALIKAAKDFELYVQNGRDTEGEGARLTPRQASCTEMDH